MSFTQGIRIINFLDADLATNTDIVLGDITGFTWNLPAGKAIEWELRGVFTLGATGGFRFKANSTTAPTAYNAEFSIQEATTPASFYAAQSAAADFTNAAAVAANYRINAAGYILANTDTVFSMQFAQNNSTANAITLLRGMSFSVWQV